MENFIFYAASIAFAEMKNKKINGKKMKYCRGCIRRNSLKSSQNVIALAYHFL